MGKLFSLVLFSAFAVNAQAATEYKTCRIDRVNEAYNVWEEGLGVFGSDADDDSETVVFAYNGKNMQYISAGQTTWRNKAGDSKITYTQSKTKKGTSTIFSINGKTDAAQFTVNSDERGTFSYSQYKKKFVTVATFDCSSVEDVNKVGWNFKAANVKLVSRAEYKKISKTVLTNMGNTDIAYELGDGYYDFINGTDRFYQVTAKGNPKKLVGYIFTAKYNYTEGDPVVALVRYDRNGLKLGEVESQ